MYRVGPMVDLCSGPHVPDTSMLKAVALTSCSRAFWRADTSKDALQVGPHLPIPFSLLQGTPAPPLSPTSPLSRCALGMSR